MLDLSEINVILYVKKADRMEDTMLQNIKDTLKGIGIILLAHTLFETGINILIALLPLLIPLGVMAAFYHLFLKH